ncbi:MAG: 16S rRNA (guanine(966)-N(2))-methyltransferase RsmD [Acidimicrobiia bacterium]
MARNGVRVIAGAYRGRVLAVPAVGTRPMTDRVRESVFSALGHRCVDAHVLDAFAGSGVIGLEAASRGAATVDFVESDRAAMQVLRANISKVAPDIPTRTHQLRIESFLARSAQEPFDLAFFDPPFALESTALATMLATSIDNGWWASDATLVVERPREDPLTAPAGFHADWERTFGGASIVMLRPAP